MTEEQKTFHEVVFNVPQKLKFDIDAPIEKLDSFVIETPLNVVRTDTIIEDTEIMDLLDSITLPTVAPEPTKSAHELKYEHVFAVILQVIRDTFLITFGIELPQQNEIICESRCSPDKVTKFSNHIIIDGFFVADHAQACEFTRRIISYLPKQYRRFIDHGVNKRIQNFRIAGCHKKDDTRTKRIISSHLVVDSLITNVDNCRKLPTINIFGRKDVAHDVAPMIHPDDQAAIIALCNEDPGIKFAHKYKSMRNGIFVFSRVRSSMCEFCGRYHDTDNTLMISTKVTGGEISVFKHCRRYIEEHKDDPGSGVFLGKIASNIIAPEASAGEQVVTGYVNKQVKKAIEISNKARPHTLFDDIPAHRRRTYSSPKMEPFELSQTLVVHAAMKMGKTKALVEYIDKHFKSDLRRHIIRFISFRQTFSNNIKEKFSDFTLYNEVKGPLTDAKLIIQVESLYRLAIYEGVEQPDLLVLDECESIFEQFDSGLLRGNFNECFSKFQYLLKYSRHVICMDANISDRTFRILARMRPPTADDILYHHNEYLNATEDSYYVGGDKLKWLGLLYTAIEADENISIPISSLAEAKVLRESLTKKYPSKKIKLYSSETAISEKREHFADVNTHWSQYDILIYTPTVSAGVSFEEEHFDKIFGYFTDQSCPVETCQQMIGRIRNISAKQYFICLAATGNNLATSIDDLRQELYTKRENLMLRNFDETGLRAEYGPNGEIKYHDSEYFYMWLENARMRNISKNSFVRQFVRGVAVTGAKVHLLSDDIYENFTGLTVTVDGVLNDELQEITSTHDTMRREIRDRTCEKISNAPDLSQERLDSIYNSMTMQEDISDDDRYAFERHRLRVDYSYNGHIDKKFVRKYYDARVRRNFKNLTRLYSYDTVESALKHIQEEEKAIHKYLMNMELVGQYQDINRKYVFDQHRFALSLLKLCGWNHINDRQYIHKIILAQNLSGNRLYWDSIGAACSEFGIRTPRPTTNLHAMLKPINKILSVMYGINIICKRGETDLFLLSKNKLFTINSEATALEKKPMIATSGRPPDA